MGGGRAALKASCDAKTKKALNVAFKLCNPDHEIHQRCKKRHKSTRVTGDVLNRFIMSILNTSGVTTTLPKFVEDNKYPVCKSILTKIDNVLGTKGGVTSTSTIPGGGSSSSLSTHNNNNDRADGGTQQQPVLGRNNDRVVGGTQQPHVGTQQQPVGWNNDRSDRRRNKVCAVGGTQ